MLQLRLFLSLAAKSEVSLVVARAAFPLCEPDLTLLEQLTLQMLKHPNDLS